MSSKEPPKEEVLRIFEDAKNFFIERIQAEALDTHEYYRQLMDVIDQELFRPEKDITKPKPDSAWDSKSHALFSCWQAIRRVHKHASKDVRKKVFVQLFLWSANEMMRPILEGTPRKLRSVGRDKGSTSLRN